MIPTVKDRRREGVAGKTKRKPPNTLIKFKLK